MTYETILILVHFFSAGIQSLIHKEAANRGADSLLFIYCQAATTCLALLIPFMVLINNESNRLLLLADNISNVIIFPALFLFLSGAFVAVSFARLRALLVLPMYIFAPLSRVSLLLVIVVSVLLLGEARDKLELSAIAVAFVPLLLLEGSQRRGQDRVRTSMRAGLVWTLLSALCVSGLQLSSKILLGDQFRFQIPVVAYVFCMNLSSLVITATVRGFTRKPLQNMKKTIKWGLLAGIANVFSFGSLSMYLVSGDASKIYPVSALSMTIPVIVMLLRKRDRLPTKRETIAFVLAMAAVVILSIR